MVDVGEVVERVGADAGEDGSAGREEGSEHGGMAKCVHVTSEGNPE